MADNPAEPLSKEIEFMNAKSYLLTRSAKTGGNLYDHLSKVLTKVLDERPNDVIDIFEDISKETKRSQFKSDVDTVQDKIDRSTEVALCQIQEKLFKKGDGEEEAEATEEDVDTPLPNLMELAFYFEQAGIGMNREECYRMWLGLKSLVDNHLLQHVRLWGKVLGTEQIIT
ncbi:RSPH4A [Bugula neritina]|uniref:RSPH4A n=1 Tax=Bugula neritina TaxID=10212 RepID=A0A7J7KAF3_BUGNE|nr:RSPH4A [Bugula neritina]